MDRRRFVQLATTAPLLLSAAPLLAEATFTGRWLVLVELAGGNDGLNTLIPLADPQYAALRPTLAIEADKAIKLSEAIGLNPALAPLAYAWDGGELAVALGVGVEAKRPTHARASGLWDTGGGQSGWLTRLFLADAPPEAIAHGAILGLGDPGPLAGSGDQAARVLPFEQLVQEARRAARIRDSKSNPALAHLIKLRDARQGRANRLQEALERVAPVKTRFPDTHLGAQLSQAARIVLGDLPVPFIKVTHRGYDTHTQQQTTHTRLLKDLADSLAAFRSALLRANRWNKVTLATISEFGRSPAENKTKGTDHGNASAHFILGGAVKGGLYGTQPPIKDFEPTSDHRALLGALAGQAWGRAPEPRWPKPLW